MHLQGVFVGDAAAAVLHVKNRTDVTIADKVPVATATRQAEVGIRRMIEAQNAIVAHVP